MSYIKTVIAVVGVAGIIGVAYHVNSLNTDLAKVKQDLVVSKENETKLMNALKTQAEVLRNKELEYASIVQLSSGLRSIAQKQSQEIKKLSNKLNTKSNGSSRDLGVIARFKPALIQKIVNNATKDANRCFEIVSGSPVLTNEVNNECKDLVSRD